MNYKLYNVFDIKKEFEIHSNLITLAMVFASTIFLISFLFRKYSKNNVETLTTKEYATHEVSYIYMILFPFIIIGLLYAKFNYIEKVKNRLEGKTTKIISGKIYNYKSSYGNSCGFENFQINGIKFGLSNTKMNMRKKYIQLVKDGANAVVIFEPLSDESGMILRLDTISYKK